MPLIEFSGARSRGSPDCDRAEQPGRQGTPGGGVELLVIASDDVDVGEVFPVYAVPVVPAQTIGA